MPTLHLLPKFAAPLRASLLAAAVICASAICARADIKIVKEHNDNSHATPDFKFPSVPRPSATDAATRAKFTIIDGQKHGLSGDISKLNDGKLPTEEDQPGENFVFDAGLEGGSVLADLGSIIDIKQVNSYSWHPNTRGPQVYKLYVSDGKAAGFDPKTYTTEPESHGWKYIANVDTRPKYPDDAGSGGGQYGVSIFDSTGSIGKFRYLLFVMFATEMEDTSGNTFYSEIDVVGSRGAAEGNVKVVVDHNDNASATPEFKFKSVPSPIAKHAAAQATFALVEGECDGMSGGLDILHDGKLPTEQDQPPDNFFFQAGTTGGSISVDLGNIKDVRQVNTYSWHPNTRGPQVYGLYASDGKSAGFNPSPKNSTDPSTAGWTFLAGVDTRPAQGDGGGQYGVSISGKSGSLGKYRYLLFVMSQTESADTAGNTFYSKINVITSGDSAK